MPTNKYDKQTTFIRTKDNSRRRLRLEADASGSDRSRHKFINLCRNLIKN